jgi:hypothetical protein
MNMKTDLFEIAYAYIANLAMTLQVFGRAVGL